MAKAISKMTDEELAEWMRNLGTVAKNTPSRFGVNAAQADEMETGGEEMDLKIQARKDAEEVARAAVAAQATTRRELETNAAYIYQSIQINPAISDADKELVNVETRKTPTKTAPTRPLDLVANGFEDDRNVLKWKRNGNTATTIFDVEAQYDGAGAFALIGSTTKTTYTHAGVTPGRKTAYRVRAKRNNQTSTWSNEAVVY